MVESVFSIPASGKPDIAAAALSYVKIGKPIFPCNQLTKKPLVKRGFLAASLEPDQIARWWHQWPAASIGMPTGIASGLFVIDIDVGDDRDGLASLRQLEQAHEPLPATRTVRTGGGGLHLIFHYPRDLGFDLGNSAGKLGPGIDTRGEGGYVVLPPSGHASGRWYQFDNMEAEIADLPEWIIELLHVVEQPRPVGSTQLPHINGETTPWGHAALDGILDEMRSAQVGRRNHTLNRLAFRLGQVVATGELSANATDHLADAARTTGLDEKEIRKTLDSGFQRGATQPAIHETLPPRTLREAPVAAEWSEQDQDAVGIGSWYAEPEPIDAKPELFLYPANRRRHMNQVHKLLVDNLAAYRMDGRLVTIRGSDGEEKTVVPVSDSEMMSTMIEDYATIYRTKKDKWVPSRFPRDDAHAMRVDFLFWRWPALEKIVTTPFLRADGSLCATDGYDASTRLYLDQRGVDFGLNSIPEQPTATDAQLAIATLDELLGTFPFVGLSDGKCAAKSAIIAAMLTAAVRHLIPTAPIFCISAPEKGTGKSKLADVVAIIQTGRAAVNIGAEGDKDELRKMIEAQLRLSDPVILLDNVTGSVISQTLTRVLSQGTITARILGKSEMATISTDVTWLATGNNLRLSSDLNRRAVLVKMDAMTERPNRRHFGWEPEDRAAERRPRYVRALLTILRGFFAAGAPTGGLSPFGSFAAWDRLVRAPLIWAGDPDPLDGSDALDDDVTDELFRAWVMATIDYALPALTASQLIATITPHVEANRALIDLAGTRTGTLESARVGITLARHANRIVRIPTALNDGFRLVRLVRAHGRARLTTYQLQVVPDELDLD
jgi:putative DNA primase/helicase